MFAKCLAISNNSPMIANNFSHFGFVFMACFYQGHFFQLLSICFQLFFFRKMWTEYHDGFPPSKIFQYAKQFPSREKKQFGWDIQNKPSKLQKKKKQTPESVSEWQKGGRRAQPILLRLLKCSNSPTQGTGCQHRAGHECFSRVQIRWRALRQLSTSLVKSLCGQSLVSNSRNTAVLFQPPSHTVAIL